MIGCNCCVDGRCALCTGQASIADGKLAASIELDVEAIRPIEIRTYIDPDDAWKRVSWSPSGNNLYVNLYGFADPIDIAEAQAAAYAAEHLRALRERIDLTLAELAREVAE